jgi:bifunctional polynucleotide phosphatase/kinase
MARKRTSPQDPASDCKKEKSSGNDSDFSWTFDELRQVFIGRYLTGAEPSSRIAAFDFDGTLSVPKSGATFPKDGQDFKLLDHRLMQRLSAITTDRSFIIFTNQMGVGRHTTGQDVRDRIHGILKHFQIPCTVFASVKENEYRKPRRGMFDLLQEEFNVEISCSDSVFVGDAAGRKKSATGPKDHSNADFLFALNCTLRFMTPEQFLAGQPIESSHQHNMQTLPLPSYSPEKWLSLPENFGFSFKNGKKLHDENEFMTEWAKICKMPRVVAVIVGIPGSGKSHFVHRFCSEWTVISRDNFGSMEKCEKEMMNIMDREKECRIVIDNTNHDTGSRKRWLIAAGKRKCTPVAVWMDMSVEQALHNNAFRRLAAIRSGHSSAQMVPTFVITKQAKEFEAPTLDQGFAEVFRISFQPDFADDSLRKLYSCYL